MTYDRWGEVNLSSKLQLRIPSSDIVNFFTYNKILLQAYRNKYKTNVHIIIKQIYLAVHIAQQILTIQRIKST